MSHRFRAVADLTCESLQFLLTVLGAASKPETNICKTDSPLNAGNIGAMLLVIRESGPETLALRSIEKMRG